MAENKINTIDEYIEICPVEVQGRLQNLRNIIREAAPEATEKMSWQMPTFYFMGNIIHFASNKKHIGLYPGSSAVEAFSQRLTEYKSSKGAIQLPLDKEFDVLLIQDIVRFSIDENIKKHERKLLND